MSFIFNILENKRKMIKKKKGVQFWTTSEQKGILLARVVHIKLGWGGKERKNAEMILSLAELGQLIKETRSRMHKPVGCISEQRVRDVNYQRKGFDLFLKNKLRLLMQTPTDPLYDASPG